MNTLLLVVAALAMGLVKIGRAEENDEPPGKALYRSLPENVRGDFLVFSLGDGYTKNSTKLARTSIPDLSFPDDLGIEDERIRTFLNLRYPQNFTSNLYVWIKAEFNLDQTKMRSLIMSRSVCLSNGNCIDVDDIGGLCCPF